MICASRPVDSNQGGQTLSRVTTNSEWLSLIQMTADSNQDCG